MCGIIGFFRSPVTHYSTGYVSLYSTLTDYWNENVIFDTIMHWRRKGESGMGILVTTTEGYFTHRAFLKQGEYLIQHGEMLRKLIDNPKVQGIVIHNRMPTSGVVDINGCHPFIGERYIMIHNGVVSANSLRTFPTWNYICDSDTERMCAILNDPENINKPFSEGFKLFLDEIYSGSGWTTIGALFIYDKWEHKLYMYNDCQGRMVYDKSGQYIQRCWNDKYMSTDFTSNPTDLDQYELMTIDPSTNKVIDQNIFYQKHDTGVTQTFYPYKTVVDKNDDDIYGEDFRGHFYD